MSNRIVALGADEENSEEIVNKLNAIGYKVTFIDYNKDVLSIVKRICPSIIISCINEHREHMYALTPKLKSNFDIPIIYISSTFSMEERIHWITFGADDYIRLPFISDELIQKILKVSSYSKGYIISDGNLEINLRYREVYFNNKHVVTTPKMFDFLCYLVERKGTVVTREEIMKNIFKEDDYESDRKIDTQIKALRKIVDPSSIITVRGIGYEYIGK